MHVSTQEYTLAWIKYHHKENEGGVYQFIDQLNFQSILYYTSCG